MNDEQTNNPMEDVTSEVMVQCSCDSTLSIEDWLRGQSGIDVSDLTLRSVLSHLAISDGSTLYDLSERQRELCLAWLYVEVSKPRVSKKVSDKDGDWSHSEDVGSLSKSDRYHYLWLANSLFKKWGEPTLKYGGWGFIGGGLHDVRNYGPSRSKR